MANPERFSYTELSFAYRGERASIPMVTSKDELTKLMKERVIPSFELMKSLHPAGEGEESGIALSRFYFDGDGLQAHNPKAIEALKKALTDAGIKIPKEPKKVDSLRPSRLDLLTTIIDSRAEDYYLNKDLVEQMFVVCPLFVKKPQTNLPDFLFDCKAEEDATTAWIPGSVAVDGRIFYSELHKNGKDRVYFGELGNYLQSLI